LKPIVFGKRTTDHIKERRARVSYCRNADRAAEGVLCAAFRKMRESGVIVQRDFQFNSLTLNHRQLGAFDGGIKPLKKPVVCVKRSHHQVDQELETKMLKVFANVS